MNERAYRYTDTFELRAELAREELAETGVDVTHWTRGDFVAHYDRVIAVREAEAFERSQAERRGKAFDYVETMDRAAEIAPSASPGPARDVTQRPLNTSHASIDAAGNITAHPHPHSEPPSRVVVDVRFTGFGMSALAQEIASEMHRELDEAITACELDRLDEDRTLGRLERVAESVVDAFGFPVAVRVSEESGRFRAECLLDAAQREPRPKRLPDHDGRLGELAGAK